MNYMVNRGKTTCWVSGQLFSRGFHAFPGRFPGRGGVTLSFFSPGLVVVLAWACCGSRSSDLRIFRSLDFKGLSARGLSSYPGFTTPLPAARSLFHFPSRSPQSLLSPQPAVSSYPGFITPLSPSFNGASRLVGLLRREEEVHRPELPLGLGAYASGRPANATSSQWAMGHQRSSALAPRGVSSRLRPNGNLASVR